MALTPAQINSLKLLRANISYSKIILQIETLTNAKTDLETKASNKGVTLTVMTKDELRQLRNLGA